MGFASTVHRRVYDLYAFYGDCGNDYPPPRTERSPPVPTQPTATPDTMRPTIGMKSPAEPRVAARTGRLVVRFTSNEAGSVGFTVTTTVAGRAAAADAARRVLVARGSATFARPARRG